MRDRTDPDLSSRLARLMFAVLMGFAWCGGPQASALAQPAAAPAAGGAADAEAWDPVEAERQLHRLFDVLEVVNRELPRDTFDPQAVIDRHGREPDKLFEWVRDNTYWVPYRGILRGATGMMMDRAGGGLDRAVLLAELLRRTGRPVRLANASLSAEQAAALLTRVRPLPQQRVPLPPAPPPDPAAEAARLGLDPDAYARAQAQAGLQVFGLIEQAVQRTAEQVPTVAAAVGALPKADPAAERERAITAVRDHWWVQYQDAGDGGAWVNLDPLLPDAAPGTTAASGAPGGGDAAAAATFNWPADASKLDPTLWHEVHVRVVAEKCDGEKLIETPALSHALRPAGVAGQDVVLSYIPLHWSKDLAKAEQQEAAEKFRKAVLAETEWMPVLTVGNTSHGTKSVLHTGDVNESPKVDAAGQVGAAAAKTFGGLGGAMMGGGGEDDAASAGGSYLSAIWVDYEIRTPGEPPQTVRRAAFDLIGPAARAAATTGAATPTEASRLRRGLSMLGRTDVLPLGGRMSPQFVQHLAAVRMLASRAAIAALVREKWRSGAELADRLNRIESGPGPAFSLAVARDAWSPADGDTYLDRPNVFTYHAAPRLAADGTIVGCAGFDIIANDVAVRPGAEDPAAVRLRQGVCDTNAEALLMRTACGVIESTAERFAETGSGGGANWVTLREPAGDQWAGLGVGPDTKARIASDLAAGYWVIVPPASAAPAERPYAWWRVDPKTGQTLGIGESGAGAATTEYALGVVSSLASAGICLSIAGLDKDGITVKDALACGFGLLAGGGGVMMAVHGGQYILTAVFLMSAALVGIGLDKNKDIPDD